MMGQQFLLTWIVLFGAVGVYCQLQQKFDEQGPNEVHVRVARSGRGYPLRPKSNIPNAHAANSPQYASRNLNRPNTQINQGASTSTGYQDRSSKASGGISQSAWEKQSRREIEFKKSEAATHRASQKISRTQVDMAKGNIELAHRISSKRNDPSLQNKLKERQRSISRGPKSTRGTSTVNNFVRNGNHGSYIDYGPSGRHRSSGSSNRNNRRQ